MSDARVTFESLLPPRQAREMYELQNRRRTILFIWKKALDKMGVLVQELERLEGIEYDHSLDVTPEEIEEQGIDEPFVDTPITTEELAAAIAAGGDSEIEVILAAQRRAVNAIEAEASAFMDQFGFGPLIILSEKEEAMQAAKEFGDDWDEEEWERSRDKLPWEWEVDEDE